MPTLYNYKTGEPIREATYAELAASIEAAERDGGAGVIEVDGLSCYAHEASRPELKIAQLKEAARCVIATAWGNGYGLTEAQQLEAVRMAAEMLIEALGEPLDRDTAARFQEWNAAR